MSLTALRQRLRFCLTIIHSRIVILATAIADMKEPYDLDVAPNGKIFVSQCGWGRRFNNMDDALGYINKMERLDEEAGSGLARNMFGILGACIRRPFSRSSHPLGVEPCSSGRVEA
ncbi:MAG TPA: hypothetical protein VN039_08300 [Nitrospira sp.]|nr:hypothetical protein [Nitrospira sp.]